MRGDSDGFDLELDLPIPWEDERRSQPIVTA